MKNKIIKVLLRCIDYKMEHYVKSWIIRSGIFAIFISTLSIYINSIYISKPEYLVEAEDRVQSYLSYEYGRGLSCESFKFNEHAWVLKCLDAKNKQFEFNVFQENIDTDIHSFYLVALNDNAKQCANNGLMQYLKIISS